MDEDWLQFVDELTIELSSLQTVRADIVVAQNRIGEREPDSFECHAVGSILHSFYQGMENISLLIIKRVDNDKMEGGTWHRDLLNRASKPLLDIRPAIIQSATAELMEDYLGFRHVFRNIYGFELDWEKMKPLLNGAIPMLETFSADIEKFLTSLRMKANDL
jgi:hypothetical protein